MEVGKFESVEHDQVNWMQDGFEIFEKQKQQATWIQVGI